MPDAAITERPALGPERSVAGAAIGAAGMAVPERIVENEPIAQRLGVDAEWIVKRIGISRRHVLGPGERLIDIAAKAGADALGRAQLDAGDVDLRLGLRSERVLDYIAEYANTSAATMPIALAEAQADGTLAPGQRHRVRPYQPLGSYPCCSRWPYLCLWSRAITPVSMAACPPEGSWSYG